jgi:hypothetical protein
MFGVFKPAHLNNVRDYRYGYEYAHSLHAGKNVDFFHERFGMKQHQIFKLKDIRFVPLKPIHQLINLELQHRVF